MSKNYESTLITDPAQAYFMAHLEDLIRVEYKTFHILESCIGPSDPDTISANIRWSAMIDAFEDAFEVSYF